MDQTNKTPIVSITSMVGWEWAKRLCLRTVGLKPIKGRELPTSSQKIEWLIGEHSHIKAVQWCIDIDNLRQWVGVHLIRHPHMLPYICSQRLDRSLSKEEQVNTILSFIKDEIVKDINKDEFRDYRLQGSTNDHSFVVNAQTVINISKKRLCRCASKETREVWQMVIDFFKETEPELASVCVPNCVYRGFCPEKSCCGFVRSKAFIEERNRYMTLVPETNRPNIN